VGTLAAVSLVRAVPWVETRRRLPRLLLGLVMCGTGIAFQIQADLGLGPWEVLHQGISDRTGIPIGTISILVGVVVLIGWIPLREKPGVGTLCNIVVIGATMDVWLTFLPKPDPLWLRLVFMAMGPIGFGIGSGFYIGAGLGPGPRDGLMTGIAARGHPVWLVRNGIEVSVTILGWLLGGTVGVGTVVFALTIGPIVHRTLPWLGMPPVATDDPDPEDDPVTATGAE
jgi:uncharacterized membrane protein YczE